MPRLNPERPRCCICDQRCRDQADLIAHRAIHSSEELASGLERAVDDGLRASLEWKRVGLNHWTAERGTTLYIIRRDASDSFTLSWQNENIAGVLARVCGVNCFETIKQYAELNQPTVLS